jgi:hypothetical protein
VALSVRSGWDIGRKWSVQSTEGIALMATLGLALPVSMRSGRAFTAARSHRMVNSPVFRRGPKSPRNSVTTHVSQRGKFCTIPETRVNKGAWHDGRVASEDCSPEAPTEPDMQISRIRLFGPRFCYATIAGRM